ncbi:hypothetical protein PE067_17755 [Paracoccus sp. DMF-8]|uniref:hypothetical protein n=1 Tax=Paracoccus sp. DMF-8 TaxID=3019445 RepID=UPI0023E3F290|nr:hypothetical protein [Paracoccus sp. DMF-8]MDF3607822.1 hypothetical protein [Paracoccus sp. DMF-8]
MSRFRTMAAGLVAAALSTGAGWADTPCSLQGLEPIPVLEKAKEHFLHGRYESFSDALQPVIELDEQQFSNIFGPISKAAPKGFDSCSTVVRRVDDGGLVQELVLYSGLNRSGRQDQILSLYLVAAPLGDDLRLVLFSMKDTIGMALDEVR